MSPNSSPPASAGQHVAAPGLWERALQTLSDSERATLRRVAEPRSSQEPIYKEVKETARLLQARSESSASDWEVKIGATTFAFRDYIRKILRGLHAFLAVGDSIMQYDPQHLALPWAGIRFLIMACVNGEEQRQVLIQIVDKFVLVIHRCRIIEELYTLQTCGPDASAVENLQTALVNLYREVLEILAKCLRHESRAGVARLAINVLRPNWVTDKLGGLVDVEAEMFKEMEVCKAQLRSDLDELVKRRLEGLMTCLEEFQAPLERIDVAMAGMLESAGNAHWQEVLDWISEFKFGRMHDSICDGRASETCGWLLERPQFSKWHESNTTSILWVQGSGGTGKTVLTSKVVDHVAAQLAHRNNEALAYFYCSHRETAQSAPLHIICSILRQLASGPKDLRPSVHEALRALHQDCQLHGRIPTFQMCEAKIRDIVGTYEATSIVIDGLNECEPESRDAILKFLAELARRAAKTVRILVASRHTPDIAQIMEGHAHLDIDVDSVQGDIVRYVEQEVQRMGWKDELRSAATRSLTPKHRHGGMFQWVALQLRQLGALSLQSVVRHQLSRLNVLPTGLQEAYDRVYRRITQRHESEMAVAIRILQWVQCSAVPPTTAEIRFAAQEDVARYSEELADDLTDDVIMTLTSHLIEQDRASGTWRFTHFSVLEYLESCHGEVYDCRATHEKAAYSCLYALIQGLPDGSSVPGYGTTLDAFAEYAKWCWSYHLRALADTELSHPGLMDLLLVFLGAPDESGADYRLWVAMMQEQRRPQRFRGVALSRASAHHLLPETTATSGLCLMGITTPLHDWIRDGRVSADWRNGENWCLLSLAVFHDQAHTWRFLLRHGARCNGIDGSYYGGPLATAAATSAPATEDILTYGGHPGRSMLVGYEAPTPLPANGAQPRDPPIFAGFGTPLAAAALEGEVAALEVLLKKGAEPNAAILVPSVPSSALAIAAWRGNAEAARKLVVLGATVDLDLPGCLGEPPRYGSALAAAAGAGKLDTVKLLVELGAEINKPLDAKFGSALAAACGALVSCPEVVRYLLDRGDAYTVNQPLQGAYGSALVAAIWAGKCREEDLREGLGAVAEELNHGAERFAEYAAVWNAVFGAESLERLPRGDAEIVAILLDRGARVTMRLDGPFENACTAAMESGNERVLELVAQRVESELQEPDMGDIYNGGD